MEEMLYDGKKVVATAILPQNEDAGFFLVRSFDIRERDYPGGSEPLMVRAVTLELTNGETQRLVVGRQKPTIIGGIEWAMAKTLKRLGDENSNLIRVDDAGNGYVQYSDLAEAFNLDYANEDGHRFMKAKTAGNICRATFELPVYRTDAGWAVFLDDAKLAAMVERFQLGTLDVATAEGDDLVDGDE